MSKAVLLAAAIALLLLAPAATAQSDSNVTQLSGLEITLGEAPLPKVGEGAANYSPEQINAARCVSQSDFVDPFGATSQAAFDGAYDASVKARGIRVAAALGKASQQEMDQAELDRQAAVVQLFPVRRWPYLRIAEYAQQSPNLKIDSITYKFSNENTRKVLAVSFVVHNLTDNEIELPPVTLVYGDVNGFVLGARTMALSSVTIAPRASMPFTLRLDNPPAYLTAIAARFQGGDDPVGREVENFDMHDCPGVDPYEKARAAGTGGALLPVQTGASPPPPVAKSWLVNYSVQDLEGLEDLDESLEEQAFVSGAVAPCESVGHRRWRDLLIAADDLSHVWEAARADQDVRDGAADGIFTPEDVAAADAARRGALDIAFADGHWSPTTAQYPKLALAPPTLQLNPSRLLSAPDGRRAILNEHGLKVIGSINGAFDGSPPPVRISALDADGYVIASTIGASTAQGANQASYSIFLPNLPAGFVSRLVIEFAC